MQKKTDKINVADNPDTCELNLLLLLSSCELNLLPLLFSGCYYHCDPDCIFNSPVLSLLPTSITSRGKTASADGVVSFVMPDLQTPPQQVNLSRKIWRC